MFKLFLVIIWIFCNFKTFLDDEIMYAEVQNKRPIVFCYYESQFWIQKTY